MGFERGDIHWVAFPQCLPHGAEIDKSRPCIILSMARVSTWRKTVVVVPLSHGSSDAPPLIVDMPSAGAGSKAFCDQIAAIDKLRIGKKIGVLAAADLRFLEECVRQVLGL